MWLALWLAPRRQPRLDKLAIVGDALDSPFARSRRNKRKRYCRIDDRQFGDVLKSHFAGKTGGLVASLMDADPGHTRCQLFSQLWACSIIFDRSFNSGLHPSFIS
jgi:hypothetical protein